MWAPIIFGIIQLLWPLFERWLVEWLEKRLVAEAKIVGVVAFGSTHEAQVFLLRRVRESLWFWEWSKRRIVDRAIQSL